MERRAEFKAALLCTLWTLLVAGTAGAENPSAIKARNAADGLLQRIENLADTDPTGPGVISEWAGASAGEPIAVWAYAGQEPAYSIVPIEASSGELIGWIGVPFDSERWGWYRAVSNPDVRPIDAAGARQILDQKMETALDYDSSPRVVSMADRRLYWHFSWSDSRGRPRESFIDLWDPDHLLTGHNHDANRLTPPLSIDHKLEPVSPLSHEQHRATNGNDYPPRFSLDVPHFFQRTPYNCGPAAIQMVFNYWGEEIDQADIASAANTRSSHGTSMDDLRRAGHFSHRSQAVRDDRLSGYNERSLGFVSIPMQWALHLPHYETRYEDLKVLVSSGYPLILVTWYDPSFTVGHYRVLKGYNDRLSVFITHDPWYAGQYMGPDVYFDQGFLVELLWAWTNDDRWALLTLPWEITFDGPDSVGFGSAFDLDVAVSYPGPLRYEGLDPVSDPRIRIDLPPGLRLDWGEEPELPLRNLWTSGSADTVSWRLVAVSDGPTGPVDLRVTASGIVTGECSSYPSYTDEIGGTESMEIVLHEDQTLSVLTIGFDTEPGSVDLDLAMNRQCSIDRLRLEGSSGDYEWEVPLQRLDDRSFKAEDRSRFLAGGGKVTYRLYCRQAIEDWRLVHIEQLTLDASIVATRLLGALPNPSRFPTEISFLVDRRQSIRLDLFDLTGRRVANLVDRTFEVGWHVVPWSGQDARGEEVATGLYFIRMESDHGHETRRLSIVE